jgi:hypothetical protein
VNPQRGSCRTAERADADAVLFKQHQQLPGGFNRLGSGLDHSRQEEFYPGFPIAPVADGLSRS